MIKQAYISIRILWGCGVLLLGAGCVSPVHRITYIQQVAPEHEALLQQRQNIYLRIDREQQPLNFSVSDWATSLQQKFVAHGMHLMAARQTAPQEPVQSDPYLPYFDPSSILDLSVHGFSVNTTTTKKEVSVGVSSPTMRKEIQTTYHYLGNLSCSIQLKNTTDYHILQEKLFSITSDSRSKINSAPDASDLHRLWIDLSQQMAQKIASTLSPVQPVFRDRRLLADPNNPQTTQAIKWASQKKWTEAQRVWEKLAEGENHDWRAAWNLGILFEVQQQRPQALISYEKAKLWASQQQQMFPTDWSQLYTDLTQSRQAIKLSPKASDWFNRPMAILPFEENTVSLDGPEYLRQRIYDRFHQGGYHILTLESGDQMFQNLGLSDGGQLPAFKREDLAKRTQTQRLLFGDIESFNETNIGLYVKREIKAKISLWDADKKQDIFVCDKEIKNQSIPESGSEVVTHFFANLASSWIQRASKKPLAAEVNQWVEECFREFPFHPDVNP